VRRAARPPSRSKRRRPLETERLPPMPASHTVAVLLDDALLTLTRAVGVLRRRNVAIEHLALRPSDTAGVSRLTFVLKTDPATADRVVQQFHKIVGVRDVMLVATEDSTTEV